MLIKIECPKAILSVASVIITYFRTVIMGIHGQHSLITLN